MGNYHATFWRAAERGGDLFADFNYHDSCDAEHLPLPLMVKLYYCRALISFDTVK